MLRECRNNSGKELWSNISISIDNEHFKIDYDYDDLANSPFSSYERHVIWRYNTLKEGDEILSRKDKKIIDSYKRFIAINDLPNRIRYTEKVYDKPVKNIIEFEKTLTVDEAIARSKAKTEKQKRSLFGRTEPEKEEQVEYKNQILNNFKK